MKRTVAIGLLLAVTMATSGCVQAITGGPIVFEASPASVSDDALQQTGYESGNQKEFTVNRTVDLPVVGERNVRISNHLASYTRAEIGNDSGSAESAGAFLLVSTPQAQVAGQGTNPLGRMPLEDVVKQVASRAGTQSNVRHVGSRDITVLGAETSVEKFSSTTEAKGETVETFVYVVRVEHGDDYVIGVGLLPKQFEDDEDAIYELMRGIEHGEG